MEAERQSRWRTLIWVLSASVALHVLIVGLFFLSAAYKQPAPAPEENVNVELVPPPEEPKPEEKKPDEKKPELPKPPEAKPEEKKPPEPPKAEPPPPPPPAPKPPEPPKPPEAPKPPPELPKPSEPKPEPKPPEQPKPPEPPEADKPNAQDTPAESSIQPLRPVVKFGDKDTAPKKSDGDSADGGTKPDDAAKPDDAKAAPAPDKPTPQQPPKGDASDKPPTDSPADAKPLDDKPPVDKPSDTALTVGKPAGAGSLPPGINLPEVDAADDHAEKDGAPGQATDAANVSLSPEQAKELADVAAQPPRPEARPTPPTETEHLTKAKTLFSQSDGGGAFAMTAIGGMSRGKRVGQLCATELSQQLLHSGYPTELLPAYPQGTGTVVNVPHSQFRSRGQWYNVSFRCEVDADATSVVSISFNIGEAVPRNQWRSRGFPED